MLMPKSKAPQNKYRQRTTCTVHHPHWPTWGFILSAISPKCIGPQSTECLECRRMSWRNAVSHQRMIKFKTNKLELVRVDKLKEVLIQHCYACSLCISIANHPTHTNSHKQTALFGVFSFSKKKFFNKQNSCKQILTNTGDLYQLEISQEFSHWRE